MRMFSNQPRKFYRRSPLIEVICQLRFPDILKIEAHEPADFQDAIRQVYPQYAKRIEQLPPQNAGGKMVEQGTVNNYQFISADGGWKVSLTKGFIALSTTRYTRWGGVCQAAGRCACRVHQNLSARVFYARWASVHERGQQSCAGVCRDAVA